MDEIKDKIILAVKKAITNRAEVVDCYHDIMEIDCNDVDHIAEEVAKCVASASSGALTEWKPRAEVAEMALEYAVSEYRCDECPCAECTAEIRGSQECIELICAEYKKCAERELAEEGKDG